MNVVVVLNIDSVPSLDFMHKNSQFVQIDSLHLVKSKFVNNIKCKNRESSGARCFFEVSVDIERV